MKLTARVTTSRFQPKTLALAISMAIAADAQGATISVGGACSLSDAIVSANTNAATGSCDPGDAGARDTITLANSSTITLLTAAVTGTDIGENGLPIVTSDITLQGNSSTVQRDAGAGDFRIFNVGPAGDLAIYDLTISNGLLSGNSLIAIDSGAGLINQGVLSLTNVVVSNNNSGSRGGGIMNFGGSLSISSSILSGNSAGTEGGGLVSRPDAQIDSLTITNSTITANNSGATYGGILLSGSTSSPFIAGSHSIAGSTISNNSATTVSGGIGAFNRVQLSLTNSVITGNSATNGPGGISNLNSTVGITGSTISLNNSSSSAGGIRNNGSGAITTITNSTITGNSSAGSGGGIFNRNSANVIINNSVISDNSAANRGGGIYTYNSASLQASGITVSNNTSDTQAAGIFHGSGAGSLTVTGSTIDNNQGVFAVYVRGAFFDMDNTQIIDNSGAGLQLSSQTVDMDSMTISRNSVGVRAASSTVSISNSTVADNSNSGGVDVGSGELNLSNVTVSGNSGGTFGGVNIRSGQIIDSRITGNYGYDQAGGVQATPFGSDQVTILNSEITNNSSSQKGGGVSSRSSGTILINGVTIANNTAGIGGGLYAYRPTVSIVNSTISSNTANANQGGGIYQRYSAMVTLGNTTISGNSAQTYGGGIYLRGSNLNLVNGTLFGNFAPNGGGGLGVSAGSTTDLSNTVIASGGDPQNCYFGDVGFTSTTSVWFEDTSCNGTAYGKPMLGPLQNNGGPTSTHELLAGSPLIDAGDDTICNAAPINAIDQRGIDRPLGRRCDIGAFEAEVQDGSFFVVPLANGKAVIFEL